MLLLLPAHYLLIVNPRTTLHGPAAIRIQILGGRVEHLAAAWETQRRYGGLERPKQAAAAAGGAGGSAAAAAAGEDDGALAPPFRHFVPGGRIGDRCMRLRCRVRIRRCRRFDGGLGRG